MLGNAVAEQQRSESRPQDPELQWRGAGVDQYGLQGELTLDLAVAEPQFEGRFGAAVDAGECIAREALEALCRQALAADADGPEAEPVSRGGHGQEGADGRLRGRPAPVRDAG